MAATGGRGGSVLIEGDEGKHTLLDTRHRKHYRGARGGHGGGARKTGRSGEDVSIRVPLGTVIKEDDGGAVLYEILRHNESWVAARGGRGGRGNTSFATSTNRAPLQVQPGDRASRAGSGSS